MKAYPLAVLLTTLLAGAAAAIPLNPEALRRERVETLARVEAVGQIIPNTPGDPRAAAFRARLEAVRDGAMRLDAGSEQLAQRKAELQALESELIALLFSTRPRAAEMGFTSFADAQRYDLNLRAAALRPATEQAVGRLEAFNARLNLVRSDPARFFDGLGLRPASFIPSAAPAWSPSAAPAGPTSAAAFRPAQSLRVNAVPAPASSPAPQQSGPEGLAALRSRLMQRGVSAQIIDTAIAEGRRQGVDPIIVLSVIEQESTWNRMAHNKGSGCRGLMQLAPATAEDMGVRGAVANPSLLHDVSTNIRAGVRYIDWIANRFFRMNIDLSDVSRVPREKLNQILASYNWGIGNVQRVVRRYGAAALERVAPAETRDYISEIPGRISNWVRSFF